MNICLFESDEISKPLSVKDKRGEHIVKILHKKEGDTFSAGIINGMAGKAVITKIDLKEEKSADGRKTFLAGNIFFDFKSESDGKTLYPLTMIIGFPRPIQLKRLLRDMAGLGVQAVHLCGTELVEKSYLKSEMSTVENCRQLLLEGTVQACSTHVPEVFIHNSLKECLDFLEKNNSCKYEKIALDNVCPQESLYAFSSANKLSSAAAAVRSERGWSENERRLLENLGYKRFSLGKRVLRTESAATVAASLILGSMGFLM